MGRKLLKNAFTLVELLVCVGVMVVLLAIMLAVLSNSQRSAKVSEDVNKLRQIGTAAHLYQADNDNVHPARLETLLISRQIPSALAQSSLDPTREGWLNSIILERAKEHPPTLLRLPTSRVSFIGFGDLFGTGIVPIETILDDGEPAGWLIALSNNRNARLDKAEAMLKGPHLRLTFGNSIVSRPSVTKDGVTSFIRLFTENDPFPDPRGEKR